MDKDQIEGATRQAEGGVEEAFGKLMGGNEDRGLGPGCCHDVI